MMVMDESRSLPERATELNWKLLLILPVTASESSLLEIDLSQGGLCGKKAAISSWWEGMIRFVLSLFSFAGVSKSDQFSPLSTRAPCWAVKANLQTCHLLFFFFHPTSPKSHSVPFPACLSAEMFWHRWRKTTQVTSAAIEGRYHQWNVYKLILFTLDEGLGSQDVFSSGLSSFLPLYGMVSSGERSFWVVIHHWRLWFVSEVSNGRSLSAYHPSSGQTLVEWERGQVSPQHCN